ncbi:uncharacterized protein LOC112465963 [Temnothorax curvispinosus]|uniref:Uncharacterized protein LOC112465963 n=1 Tax=Temnothorax curvispinosus TaxID=300111 RepID=A0A6J1R5T8_9HYME|nr:uncharacterized protein LOC112465963 [Temnothorax curvispinosus]
MGGKPRSRLSPPSRPPRLPEGKTRPPRGPPLEPRGRGKREPLRRMYPDEPPSLSPSEGGREAEDEEGGGPILAPSSFRPGETSKTGAARSLGQTAPAKKTRRQLPRATAVIIICPEGQYGKVMAEIRRRVSLQDLGVGEFRVKRAITGALTLEVPGPDSFKADLLCQRVAEAVAGRVGVRVARPVKTAEIRVNGLDDSVSTAELAETLARKSACPASLIQVGPIRRAPSGTGTAWVRCLLAAANRVVAECRLTVGWALAGVDLLEQRPLQCFRCLEGGYVRAQCRSEIDRSGQCYRCGEPGHRAQNCAAPLRCPLCFKEGAPAHSGANLSKTGYWTKK